MGVVYGIRPEWIDNNLAKWYGISSGIVTDGLVLALDASVSRSYPGSGTTWTDLSGNGNNGTLTNGPTYNSANGGSIVFDGTDDYGSVSCSQFQSGNNPFTMEVWFRWSGNGTNTSNNLFGYGNDGQNTIPLIMVNSNSVRFEFGSGSGVVNSSTIQTNTWYHAVATYNLSSNQIYLDGSLQNTTSYSVSYTHLTLPTILLV